MSSERLVREERKKVNIGRTIPQAVEAAIRRDKRPEVRQRCTAIRLLHLGHKPEQVAEMQAVSIPTICRAVQQLGLNVKKNRTAQRARPA